MGQRVVIDRRRHFHCNQDAHTTVRGVIAEKRALEEITGSNTIQGGNGE